jgi:hypothetical protein
VDAVSVIYEYVTMVGTVVAVVHQYVHAATGDEITRPDPKFLLIDGTEYIPLTPA